MDKLFFEMLAHGVDGAGCYHINKNLVRRMGIDAALLLTELIQTNLAIAAEPDDWFVWLGVEFLDLTGWDDQRLKDSWEMIQFHKLAEIKRTPDGVVMFRLKIQQIINICRNSSRQER